MVPRPEIKKTGTADPVLCGLPPLSLAGVKGAIMTLSDPIAHLLVLSCFFINRPLCTNLF